MESICRVCGKAISAEFYRKKICSAECKKASMIEIQRQLRQKRKESGDYGYPETQCVWCKKVFKPRTKTQTRCSTECSRAYLQETVYRPRRLAKTKEKELTKAERIKKELNGRSFSQALVEKYGLNMEGVK